MKQYLSVLLISVALVTMCIMHKFLPKKAKYKLIIHQLNKHIYQLYILLKMECISFNCRHGICVAMHNGLSLNEL